MKTEIRRFINSDAEQVSMIINRCFNEILVHYHDKEMLQEYLRSYSAPEIIRHASYNHVYTVLNDNVIVGTGTISLTSRRYTSLLEGIYISPDCQNCGFGRIVIETLEQDEFYIETLHTELHATGPGVNFYRHLGYLDRDVLKRPDEEGLYIMDKYHII